MYYQTFNIFIARLLMFQLGKNDLKFIEVIDFCSNQIDIK